MKRLEQEALAKRIVHFFENNGNHDLKITCRHFMAEGIARSTIKDIIRRYQQRGSIIWKAKLGRPAAVATPKVVNTISKLYHKDPTTSVRSGAAKVGLKKSTYDWIKVHKLGITARRKQTVPKYTGNQKERAKTACRKIYRKRLLSAKNKILVIDDETYVPAETDQVPGLEYYHCSDKSTVPDQYRFKPKAKFCKKFLVWQAIDELGNVSDPFISTGTITGEVYLNECLKKRLMPFIQKYHETSDILFWMDMATSHYKGEVIEWLTAQGIDFIEKDQNAPNVPQARPIEKFWALCKAKYKLRKNSAKSLSSFKRIWKNISATVACDSAQTLMKEARRNLREIGYGGVHSPYK